MSRFEASLSSGEAVVEEVGGDNRRCNAGSAIIEAQLPTAILLNTSAGLIGALLCVVNYFFVVCHIEQVITQKSPRTRKLSNAM